MKLKIYQTANLVNEALANFIIELAAKSIMQRGRFVIALSGGNTPNKLYALLATPKFKAQIDWGKTFIFWGDERCVPLNDPSNNAFGAKSLLLDEVAIPTNNFYPIPVNLKPKDAAKEYQKTLQEFFGKAEPRFDLILLGLGADGHTASIFPHSCAIYEKTDWVKEVCQPDGLPDRLPDCSSDCFPEQKMPRITLTPSLINQARNIVFLVIGKEKAKIFKEILSESNNSDKYPAQLILPSKGVLYWFVDDLAAAEMKAG